MTDEVKRPADVPALLQLLHIDSVEYYELSGKVKVGFDLVDDTEIGPEQEEQLQLNVGPALRLRRDGLDVRCRLTVQAPSGTIVADGAVFYNSVEPIDVDHDIAVSFADNVGIMALIPYLRQAVDDLSMRLLFPSRIILPVLPRGAITFGHLQPDEAARVEDDSARLGKR